MSEDYREGHLYCKHGIISFPTPQGTSILRPSQHGNGTTAAPYRMRELAIPQAYVMQRGHKVFFTAAEDMVIGSKCDLIQRELQERERVCREVADVTMTTSRLNEKAVGYEETDERVSSLAAKHSKLMGLGASHDITHTCTHA